LLPFGGDVSVMVCARDIKLMAHAKTAMRRCFFIGLID
jgi:hypothetical protein